MLRRALQTVAPRPWAHAFKRAARNLLGLAAYERLMGRGHRLAGYSLLSGCGLEIGAMHAPAPVPVGCDMVFADAITRQQASEIFPEIDASRIVDVDLLIDLDAEGLTQVPDGAFDFVIMNHVIEHVANPISVVGELFRVVRPGGWVVLSAPDMRFTFDRSRGLTSNEHLLEEFESDVRRVTDKHYEEFVGATAPGLAGNDFRSAVLAARERREHAHVWNSQTFSDFLRFSLSTLRLSAEPRVTVTGDENGLEHFSVWQKR